MYVFDSIADGWLGVRYYWANGRIQGFFQAMAYKSGNIYWNDCVSFFCCGFMLRNACMYHNFDTNVIQ